MQNTLSFPYPVEIDGIGRGILQNPTTEPSSITPTEEEQTLTQEEHTFDKEKTYGRPRKSR